jgi:hypothetical protein
MEQLCEMYNELWRIQYPSGLYDRKEEFDEILMKKCNVKSILETAVTGIIKMYSHIRRIYSEIAALGVHTQYTWQTVVQGRLDAAVLRRKMRILQNLYEACESHTRVAEKRSDDIRAHYEDRAYRVVASYMEDHPWDNEVDAYADYMEDHKNEDPLDVQGFHPFRDLVNFILDEAYGPLDEVNMNRILPKWNGKSDMELDTELVDRFGDDAATIKACAEKEERRYRSIMYSCAHKVSEIAKMYFPVA